MKDSGHYDIIYKAEGVQPLAPTQSVTAAVEVRLAHRFITVDNWSPHGQSLLIEDVPFQTTHEPDTYDSSANLPDHDVPGGTRSFVPFSTSFADLVDEYAPPMPVSSFLHGLPAAVPQLTSGYQDPFSSMMEPTCSSAYQHPGSSSISSRPAPSNSAGPLGPTPARTYSVGPFRPSTYQFEASHACQDLPLRTKPMIE